MNLHEEWLAAKAAEAEAVAKRRAIEDMLVKQYGIDEGTEGTLNFATEGYKVKVVARLTRKVDGDVAQQLAAEFGLTDHLSRLFRWTPEINASAWKATDPSITDALLPAITTKPGRPSFTIEKE